MYIKPTYANNYFYHIYNRGIAKQPIFNSEQDYLRLLKTFSFYIESSNPSKLSRVEDKELSRILSREPKEPLVEICAYCLMPNHFHLLIRQIVDNGILFFLKRSLDSYTRYFNVKNDRIGTIFQGRSKGILVESDEQLLHLSRYIHLNPYIADICEIASHYNWSSYYSYLSQERNRLCHQDFILNMVGGSKEYKDFVEDYAGYAREIAGIKDLLHE